MGMRLTEVVVQWLEDQEWNERPDVDEEGIKSSTHFKYTLGDYVLDCFFDIDEQNGFFQLFMIFEDNKVPASRMDEVIKWVNLANCGNLFGGMQLLQEPRLFRLVTGLGFADATCEPQHITNICSYGIAVMTQRIPQFLAVCFAGKTAEEAMEIMQIE